MIVVTPELTARVGGLADALRERGWRIATAESCTGGMIAAACTDLAGSSDWFEAGWVTYSNAAKAAAIGVPAALIDAHGAVSAEVAAAMARGALLAARVPLAVAVTGIAGPGGGSAEKPVGTVWVGLAWQAAGAADVRCRTECLHLYGDRASIRAQTLAYALDALTAAARRGDGAPGA